MALINTLQDNFNGTTINTSLWSTSSASQSSGYMNLPANLTASAVSSVNTYTLTGSSVFINLAALGDVSTQFDMKCSTSGGRYMNIEWQGNGSCIVLYHRDSSTVYAGAIVRDPNYRWWRVSADASGVYCDLSYDGIAWTNYLTDSWQSGETATASTLTLTATTAGNPKIPVVYQVDGVNVAPTSDGGGSTPLTDIPKDSTKTYIYKVYDRSGAFKNIWRDVTSSPHFTQQIGSAGTTMSVDLARSPDDVAEFYDNLIDQSSSQYQTQASDNYIVKRLQSNTVGSGSDVDMGYFVDVYVIYGYFDYLVDDKGNPYATDSNDPYVVSRGSPTGTRIFSGFILDYTMDYGGQDGAGVTVTLASNGYELSQDVVRDSAAYTTTSRSMSGSPESIISTIVNTNAIKMATSSASLTTSGLTVAPTFQLNDKVASINSVVSLCGAGYYWFGNPADNLVYFGKTGTTANHTFIQGKHLKKVSIKQTMGQMVNDIYFIGGPNTSASVLPNGSYPNVLKHYTDPGGSLTTWGRRGLYIKSDQRYTNTTSMQNVANSIFANFAQPIYATTIEITAATYDIESILLGQIVTFRNFGNVVDSLKLQIVAREYTPYSVTLTLGYLLQSANDITSEVEQDQDLLINQNLPSSPS